MLRPIGHRILVKPDEPEETSAGGLILPQQRDHVATSGIVVAVGPGGSLVRYRARQRAIRDCVRALHESDVLFGEALWGLVREELAQLLGTSDPEHELQVGDRVAFAPDVGLIFVEDGEEYITLNEDDVVIVVEDVEAVA